MQSSFLPQLTACMACIVSISFLICSHPSPVYHTIIGSCSVELSFIPSLPSLDSASLSRYVCDYGPLHQHSSQATIMLASVHEFEESGALS